MPKCLVVWVSCVAMIVAQTRLLADPHDEGMAAGQAANTAARGQVTTSGAQPIVPGYTATPPQAGLFKATNLTAQANAQLIACALMPDDPGCDAQRTAITSAGTPRAVIGGWDPSVAQVHDIARDPGGVLGDLSSYYSGCAPTPTTLAPRTTTQQCLRTVGSGNYACRRDLVAKVDHDRMPACTPGAWFVEGQTHRLPADFMQVQGLCEPSRTDHKLHFRTYVTGADRPSCSSGWIEFDLDLARPAAGSLPPQVAIASASWDIDGCRPVHVYAEPAGCSGDTCAVTFHYFLEIDGKVGGFIPAAGSKPTTYTVAPGPGHWTIPLSLKNPAATVTPMEAWDDRCPTLQAGSRCVQDGQERCVDGPSTKTIGGVEMTRACWSYERRLTCGGAMDGDQCAPLAAAGCTRTHSICAKLDPATGACRRYQETYACPTVGETTASVSSCAANVYCLGSSCFNTSHPMDTDFARSMSYMEAAREAEVYLDPAHLRVFRGEDNRCRDRLLKNCCFNDRQGVGMTNNAVFGAGSRLVYDVLMNRQNREFITAGMQAMVTGSGFAGDYSTYGFTMAVNGAALPSGSVALMQFSGDAGVAGAVGTTGAAADSVVIAYDPWSAAIAVIIYVAMSMMACGEDEGKLSLKRGANLCHEVGDYCSSKFVGACVETTHTHCCFNSVLSRLINEQGRQQVGRRWGGAQTPDCSGFTIAELQSLDFAAMDFSEFYASITPTVPDVAGVRATNARRAPSCYYGDGKC